MNEKIVILDESFIKKIRCLINKLEKRNELLQKKSQWNQLCASLNALEDSMWAIQYYIETEYPSDTRGKYLFTYGLLQALYLQQDALCDLNKSLFQEEIQYKEHYPKIFEIRNARDDLLHPTRRCYGTKFIRLVQISMQKDFIEYIKSDDTEPNIVNVNVMESIEQQSQYANQILQRIAANLEESFRGYIEMYKSKKISAIFEGYEDAKEKALAEFAPSDLVTKSYGIQQLKEIIEACKKELDSRYISWKREPECLYLIEEIDEVYDLIMKREQDFPPDISDIVKKYLLQNFCYKVDRLREYCKNIDAYFEN